MTINVQAFLDSLTFMGEGMLSIFAIMLVIIGVVYALGHLTSGEKDS